MAGYTGTKEDYLKRLRRIEGQVRGHLPHGWRRITLLHRRPHPDLRSHQGPPGREPRPAGGPHEPLRPARRPGGDEEGTAKIREASDAIARLVRS